MYSSALYPSMRVEARVANPARDGPMTTVSAARAWHWAQRSLKTACPCCWVASSVGVAAASGVFEQAARIRAAKVNHRITYFMRGCFLEVQSANYTILPPPDSF